MSILARVSTVAFALWLTAAWTLPTCCWSMTLTSSRHSSSTEPSGHYHQPPAATHHTHHHSHHAPEAAERISLPAETTVASGDTQDCVSERDIALRPTNDSETLKDDRAADHAVAHLALSIIGGTRAAPVLTPPGAASPLTGFRTPLRV